MLLICAACKRLNLLCGVLENFSLTAMDNQIEVNILLKFLMSSYVNCFQWLLKLHKSHAFLEKKNRI